MPGNYAIAGNQATNTSSYKSVASLVGSATIAPKLYDLTIGANAVPADNTLVWLMQRMTADGTGTSYTPVSISQNPGIATPIAAASASKVNHTVEPTYTANANLIGPLPLNQRAAYRWVAAPGGEIVVPAIATNGVGLQSKSSAYTGESDATIHFSE